MRRSVLLLLALALLLCGAAPIQAAPSAERRIALVIGNAAYPAAPLKNPVNDARDMARALRSLGFDVIARENASLAQMEGAVNEFWGKLKKGGAGLFYFAGHGLQVNGRNYLVPVDARLEAEQDARYKCMDAGLVLGRMENAGNGLNIIILDACRNNPFARSWRSADAGLAKMDAPKGSIIAYATAPDSVAADGEDKNGLYTEKLLQAMRAPGQPVEQMFKRVRDEVMRATKDKQVPWESTSLRGDFYFTGRPSQGGQVSKIGSINVPSVAKVVNATGMEGLVGSYFLSLDKNIDEISSIPIVITKIGNKLEVAARSSGTSGDVTIEYCSNDEKSLKFTMKTDYRGYFESSEYLVTPNDSAIIPVRVKELYSNMQGGLKQRTMYLIRRD